jgi:hypothetical protein
MIGCLIFWKNQDVHVYNKCKGIGFRNLVDYQNFNGDITRMAIKEKPPESISICLFLRF